MDASAGLPYHPRRMLLLVLLYADLFQLHLWLALVLGIVLRRRWRQISPAVGVATAFYCAATSGLSVLPFSPSLYLVTIFGYAVAGWPRAGEIAPVRAYVFGLVSLWIVLCVLPTGVTALVSRRSRVR
jgi:hypothetical protein